MPMKFTVLGCGTSTGVPVPGCSCKVCTSQSPFNTRLRTSGLLTLETGENILIDAGTDLRIQALQNNIQRVDAVLFTHSHSDHILGVDDLRCFNFQRKDPIPCYGEKSTLHEIKRVFNYLFENNPQYEGGLLAKLSLHEIYSLQSFTVLGETITPFRVMHGSTQVTGFRIRDFVYATDCNSIPDESVPIMSDAQILMLDGLRFRQHGTHFTIEQATLESYRLHAKQTYFIHMTHDVDYDQDSRNLPPGIAYAYDGMTVNID